MDCYTEATDLGPPFNLSADFNLSRLITSTLGPATLSLCMIIPVSVVYSVVFILGLTGNVLTCIIIWRHSYMRTSTNYYLFSLAVSDVLMLLFGLPLEMYTFWKQYPYSFPRMVCSGRALISEMTTNASIMTIMAFTVERYFAICHPIRTQTTTTLTRPKFAILFIWIIAFMSATPYYYYVRVNYLEHPLEHYPILESAWCGISFDDQAAMHKLFLIYTSFFFILPVGLLTVLYVKIALTLRKSERRQQLNGMRTDSSTSDPARRTQSRKSIVRMLAAVCMAFFVCWAPFHTQRLLWSLVGEWSNLLYKINGFLYSIAGCCYYSNCVINVVIYNVMSHRFREAFCDTVCRCAICSSKRMTNREREAFTNSLITQHSIPYPCRVAATPPYRRQSSLNQDSRRTSNFSPRSDRSLLNKNCVELYVVSPDGQLAEEGRLRQGSDDYSCGPADPFLGSQYLHSAIPNGSDRIVHLL